MRRRFPVIAPPRGFGVWTHLSAPLAGLFSACRRLHFLMATAIAEKPGTEVGHFTIRFTEGKTVRVPLRLGEEIADWWFGGAAAHRARLGGVAWEGDNESTRYHAGTRRLQLSKWTWENPRPGTAVGSVNFVSAMTRSAPFLLAITAE